MKRVKMMLIITIVLILITVPTAAYAADYSVQPSDTLYKLSQIFKVPVDSLKKDNYLNTDTLRIGQTLYVPALLYTVKSGDTLYLIAKQNGIPLTSLRKANAKWDDQLIPGQKLMIPGVRPEGGTGTVISYTKDEVDLLARLIESEASGEIYQTKVGVGAVVVNRVQSSDWPNTITDVINQVINGYYQFTPVKNNMIQNTASDDSLRAAWAALYGSDPSNDAIFYFDESSTNQFLWSKTQTAFIDHIVFVK